MTRVLLVPDLPLERWPSMDRYAHRLYDWLESGAPEFEVRLAASIGELTREQPPGRRSGAFVRWWTQPVDPVRFLLPGPLAEPQRYAARYVLYPWRLRREARRAQLIHILDHSYAHLLASARRAGAQPRRVAHPGGGVRRAARRQHGGAQERAARDRDGGSAARRGGRVPVAGGGTLQRRSATADRAAQPAPLRAQRHLRRRA